MSQASPRDIGVLKRVNGIEEATPRRKERERNSTKAMKAGRASAPGRGGASRRRAGGADGGGGGALEAAEGLERFLSRQKKRVAATTAKHEWLLGWQRLAEEASKMERQLDASLSSETLTQLLFAGGGDTGAGPATVPPAMCLGLAGISSMHPEAFEQERVAMYGESSLLSAMVAATTTGEASHDEVRRELDAASSSCRAQVEDVRLEEMEISRELSAAWPSVIPTRAGHGLNEARAETERFLETLESMLAEHPRAAHALRGEVDAALEELEQRRDARLARIAERERVLREEATSSTWSLEQQEPQRRIQRGGYCGAPVLQTVPQTELASAMGGDSAARAASWLGARRRLAAARRSAAAMCQEDRRHLLVCIRRLLVQMETALAEARRELDEGERRGARQRELHGVLEEARARRESAALDARQRQAEAELRLREEKERSDAAFLARLESQKELVAVFQCERRALREAEEERRREEERREKEVVASRAGFNAGRVSFRKGLLEERARCRREEEAARAASEQMRLDRLDAMAARVAVIAEKDPERLLHKTKALELREAADAAQALFPVHGYSNDELMRDEGFRVGLAIREAGLHTSSYARTALHTLAQPRRDTMHTGGRVRPM